MSAAPETTAESVVPDSIEPYIGYKYLAINADGTLYSLHQEIEWPAMAAMEAKCEGARRFAWQATRGTPRQRVKNIFDHRGYLVEQRRLDAPEGGVLLPAGYEWSWEPQPVDHDPVDENCTCGIYAAESPYQCEHYQRPNTVLVKIALWGKVIKGDFGARGQYAYPQAVFMDENRYAPLVAAKYGIPVIESLPKEEENDPTCLRCGASLTADGFCCQEACPYFSKPQTGKLRRKLRISWDAFFLVLFSAIMAFNLAMVAVYGSVFAVGNAIVACWYTLLIRDGYRTWRKGAQ